MWPDPRLGDGVGHQQAPADAGHRPCRSWPASCPPDESRVGRFGHMSTESGGQDLLRHTPPTRAALQREITGHRAQLGDQPRNVSRSAGAFRPPTPPDLAALGVHIVDCQLAAVHIERSYDAYHGDFLELLQRVRDTTVLLTTWSGGHIPPHAHAPTSSAATLPMRSTRFVVGLRSVGPPVSWSWGWRWGSPLSVVRWW